MAQYGFVYILGNQHMPDVIKIGCSERSPHLRAAELSAPTGVPSPFKVLCYAEFAECFEMERRVHEWCSKYRINPAREFFQGCTRYAVQILFFSPSRLSFTDCTASTRLEFTGLEHLVCEGGESSLQEMPSPYRVHQEEEERLAALRAADKQAEADDEAAAEAERVFMSGPQPEAAANDSAAEQEAA